MNSPIRSKLLTRNLGGLYDHSYHSRPDCNCAAVNPTRWPETRDARLEDFKGSQLLRDPKIRRVQGFAGIDPKPTSGTTQLTSPKP